MSLGTSKIFKMGLFLSSIEFIKKKISNLNYGFGSDPEVTLAQRPRKTAAGSTMKA